MYFNLWKKKKTFSSSVNEHSFKKSRCFDIHLPTTSFTAKNETQMKMMPNKKFWNALCSIKWPGALLRTGTAVKTFALAEWKKRQSKQIRNSILDLICSCAGGLELMPRGPPAIDLLSLGIPPVGTRNRMEISIHNPHRLILAAFTVCWAFCAVKHS